ncbi:MAG: hypothetical protein AAF798_06000 [Bacteroidota bacterium]
MRLVVILLLVVASCWVAVAQPAVPIVFNNPSFEDEPQHSRPPLGWFDCSATKMSPIDTHPSGAFGVEKLPADGNSYVGMVIRDNYTWERFGQQLPQALVAGQAYTFDVALGQSRFYLSTSMRTQLRTNFVAPVVLRVWGGYKNCNCAALLALSPPINHFDWRSYQFKFIADLPYTHITFEAYYVDEELARKQNGHLLMDQLSPIYPLQENKADPMPLAVMTPKTYDQTRLSSFIKEQGQRIKINNSQLFLEQHTFLDPQERQWVSNQFVWEIGQQLLQHPTQQLIIAIDRETFIFESLKQQLTQQLVDIGLYPEKDFIIKKWKKKYRKQNWLWPIKEEGISMRIETY